jgi:hypothetical protein
MMMEEFEYHNLLKQLNEEKILIFDDIMHRKQLYLDIPICFFFTRGVGTNKTFILKNKIKGLLLLYNKNIYFELAKNKALLMASTNKDAFNIDGLTIHSTLNIIVHNPYLIY